MTCGTCANFIENVRGLKGYTKCPALGVHRTASQEACKTAYRPKQPQKCGTCHHLGRSFAFGPFCLAHSTSSKEEAGMHKVVPERRSCADYQAEH